MSFIEHFMPRLGRLRQYAPRQVTKQSDVPQAWKGSYPTISLVTPSFNQGHFIADTLDSVLGQGYPALEYVVQDGGSTDGTADVLRRYAGRLAAWRSQPDGGQADAVNKGFEGTRGEVMGWLNSDDLLLPGALATVARYFAEHPDVDVVYGDRLLIDEEGREVGRWILPGHDGNVLRWIDFIPQETVFWRRRIWDAAGGMVDDSFHFAMDWDLLARFQAAGARFAHIPRFLGAFRIHSEQKTSAQIRTGKAEMNRVRMTTLGRVPSRLEVILAATPYLLRHMGVDACYSLSSAWGVKHRVL
ncbi:MAG: glycosyltransferase family 2 protein [Hyphomicrobium sp.]|jgi:carbamoyltransferase